MLAFTSVRRALACALAIQRRLDESNSSRPDAPLRLRIGLNVGDVVGAEGRPFGAALNGAARVAAVAAGGEIVVCEPARQLAGTVDGVRFCDLGRFRLRGFDEPWRLYRVDAAGQDDVARARVGRRRLHELMAAARSLRARPANIEAVAWSTRALVGSAGTTEREELVALAGSLLIAARTAGDADRLLPSIDRRALARQLREQRELSVLSRRARDAAAALERRSDDVEQLETRRRELDSAARAVEESVSSIREDLLRTPPSIPAGTEELARLREVVETATRSVDEALERVARAAAALPHKRRRTRHRGVYREGGRYVVPFEDDLGRELVRTFATASGARAFARSLRAEEEARQYSEEASRGREQHPSSGTGPS
jgi:hypothetical protein